MATHGAREHQPMETDGCVCKQPKKKQRDAQRLQAFQDAKLQASHSQLAGCLLSNASCIAPAGLSATIHGRLGCALGTPRHGLRSGASCVACCGERGGPVLSLSLLP